MSSEIKADKWSPASGTAGTIGDSGDTFTVPTGVGLTVTDEVKTNKISPASGTAFTLGDSGDTFTVPAGATITNSGTATGFGGNVTEYFHAYKSADQSISSSSFTTVTFNTEQWDSGNNFASNTFTAPSTGYYWIYSQLVWSGSWSDNYTLNRFMKNGSAVSWAAIPQRNSQGWLNARVIHLSASDTVLVQTYQESGSSRDLRGSSEDECFFGGYKLPT